MRRTRNEDVLMPLLTSEVLIGMISKFGIDFRIIPQTRFQSLLMIRSKGSSSKVFRKRTSLMIRSTT